MYLIESLHKLACRRRLTFPIALTATLLGSPDCVARCLGSGDPIVDAAEENIARNPTAAIASISEKIAATDPSERRRIAFLYLAEAVAHRMDGSDGQPAVRKAAAAAQGISRADPLWLHLRLMSVDRLEDADITRTLAAVAKDYRSLPAGTAVKTCIATQLAYFLSELGQLREAFFHASQGYRNIDGSPESLPRADAASMLAYLVSTGRDYAYANELHSEALEIYLTKGSSDLAANELVLRGYASLEDDDWQGALEDFRASAAQAQSYGNDYAVQYALLGVCYAALTGDQTVAARPACERAYKALYKPGEQMAFRAAVLKSALLVKEGAAREALEILDAVHIDDTIPDFEPDAALALETRADAYNLLGLHEEAFAELQRANEVRRENEVAERQAEMNVTQARFQTEQLQDRLSEEERQAHASERLAVAVTAGAGATLSLLTVLLYNLLRNRRKFHRIAMSDVLTGLPNRRAIQIRAREALAAARETGSPISFALLDLDNFKSCNDRFGHYAGDKALQAFAKLAQEAIRRGDAIGRWGGEEFLLLLPDSTTADGIDILERLRTKARTISFDAAPGFELRFSAGLVEQWEDEAELTDLLKIADRRLYRAKALGRDRTCFDGDDAMDGIPAG